MIMPMYTQFRLVLYSLIAGIITGVLFDVYRVFRGLENPNRIITFIQDTLFWVLCAIIVFIFLLYMNEAMVGPYVYMCIAIGLYIYVKSMSKAFIDFQYGFTRIFCKIIRIITITFLHPFRVFIYKLRNKNK